MQSPGLCCPTLVLFTSKSWLTVGMVVEQVASFPHLPRGGLAPKGFQLWRAASSSGSLSSARVSVTPSCPRPVLHRCLRGGCLEVIGNAAQDTPLAQPHAVLAPWLPASTLCLLTTRKPPTRACRGYRLQICAVSPAVVFFPNTHAAGLQPHQTLAVPHTPPTRPYSFCALLAPAPQLLVASHPLSTRGTCSHFLNHTCHLALRAARGQIRPVGEQNRQLHKYECTGWK